MTLTKDELFLHITKRPGQTKTELAQSLSHPGYQITIFHLAGLLREMVAEGIVDRVTDHDKRQVYRPALPGRVA